MNAHDLSAGYHAQEWNMAFDRNPVPGFRLHARVDPVFPERIIVTAETYAQNRLGEAKAQVFVQSITRGPDNLRALIVEDLVHKLTHEAYIRPLSERK